MTEPPSRPTAPPPPDFATTRKTGMRSPVFAGLGFLMTALVVWGFWPSYFGRLVSGAPTDRHWLIHVHAVVFAGWLALFIVQAALVSRRRTRLHRRIGQWGAWYGGFALLLGLAASIVSPALHVAAGDWTLDRAASFLIWPLGDLVLFGGFLWAAIHWKDRPDWHRRLMLLATVAFIFPGVARAVRPPTSEVLRVLVWIAPVLIAAAADLFRDRRVHPVYLVGSAILVAAYSRGFVDTSEAWLGIGRFLVSLGL